MNIFKVARIYQKKLAQVSSNVVEQLRQIMGYASSLSASQPANRAAKNLASKSYQIWNTIKNPGAKMTADQMDEQLETLRRMVQQTFPSVQDSAGKNKLYALNRMLSSVQPVSIGMVEQKQAPAQEELPEEFQDVVRRQTQEPAPLPWAAKGPQKVQQTPTAPMQAKPAVAPAIAPTTPQATSQPQPAPAEETKITQPPKGWTYKRPSWQ